jgi:hypothetical protein
VPNKEKEAPKSKVMEKSCITDSPGVSGMQIFGFPQQELSKRMKAMRSKESKGELARSTA